MILREIGHLSIWEIAHRWFDCDPNTSDPKALPLNVQDILRIITLMQSRQELPILKQSGVELKSERTFCDFESFEFELDLRAEIGEKFDELPAEELESLDLTIRKEAYFEALDKWSRPHLNAIEGLDECFKGRAFDKARLETIHLDRLAIQELCQKQSLGLPAFWFSTQELENFKSTGSIYREIEKNPQAEGEEEQQDTHTLSSTRLTQDMIDRFWDRLSSAQKHRILAKEVAGKIWKENPCLTQAQIIEHEAMQKYCGAAYYSDPNTVRNWIRELDPRPPENRRGRPGSQIPQP
ncbi:hypothetical protein [Marinobacter apostichopi]|uniref:hypothetical protein n=1 Tax=Marinobacter apostichopi TaxID=3035454 RepID=UPI0025736D47|nr:hypothetical protein [Marinobacter sp. LA51]